MGILDPSRISLKWVIWYIHMAFDGHGNTCIPLQQVPYFNKFLQNHQVTITNTHKKNSGWNITNQRHISFLCLDNETVESRYQLMVGFKVVSYFKLIILCRIFYLCSKDYQGWFFLNSKAGHKFLFEGRNVWISRQTEEK